MAEQTLLSADTIEKYREFLRQEHCGNVGNDLCDTALSAIAMRERLAGLEAREQVMLDLHTALGVKFGDDPYARIQQLKDAANERT